MYSPFKSILKTSIATGALVGTMSAAPALAQNADEGSSADAGPAAGNVIVVTARKQEETILDAPIAVTALSQEQLEAAGIDNIVDIAAVTPGLDFESFNTLPNRQDSVPNIRGVVVDAGIPDPTAQPVGVFIDGIPVTGGTKNIGTEDIARVEVIKGPQSATFGRATFAGAINFVTVDPSDEFGGRVSLSAATRGEYEAIGVIEGPIAGDTLKGRLSGRFSSKDGHYDNFAVPGERLGDEQTWSVGGTLLFEPSSDLRIKARAFYSEISDGPAAVALQRGTTNNFGPFGDGDEDIFAGTLPNFNNGPEVGLNTSDQEFQFIRDALLGANTVLLRDDALDFGFGLRLDSFRASLDAEYTIPGSNVVIDAILGYNKQTSSGVFDIDNTPDAAFSVFNPQTFSDYFGELRVSGESFGERLRWSVGSSYYSADFENNYTFVFFLPGSRNPATTAITFGGDTGTTLRKPEAIGIFGQLDFDITDTLSLTLEGRYQWDEVNTGTVDLDGVFTPGNGAPATFKSFLPRATVAFEPTPDTLLYATYSKGNLPGGFNTAFTTLTPSQVDEVRQNFPLLADTYDEESLENYELGWKQSFANNRASIQLAGFFMKRSKEVVTTVIEFTNDQTGPGQPATETATVLLNAQTSDIYGFEFQGDIAPTDYFSAGMTLAYTKPKIVDFPEVAESVGDVRDVLGSDATSIGQLAPRFPDWTGSAYGQMTQPTSINLFGSEADFFTRADYYYTGRRYLTLVNVGKTPTAHVVNLRAGFKSENATIEAFITNFLGEQAVTAANNTSDLSFTRIGFGREGTSVGLRDKRQFGIRTTINF